MMGLAVCSPQANTQLSPLLQHSLSLRRLDIGQCMNGINALAHPAEMQLPGPPHSFAADQPLDQKPPCSLQCPDTAWYLCLHGIPAPVPVVPRFAVCQPMFVSSHVCACMPQCPWGLSAWVKVTRMLIMS
jgi:hypothetical protein